MICGSFFVAVSLFSSINKIDLLLFEKIVEITNDNEEPIKPLRRVLFSFLAIDFFSFCVCKDFTKSCEISLLLTF